jgi:hypothetical protein
MSAASEVKARSGLRRAIGQEANARRFRMRCGPKEAEA